MRPILSGVRALALLSLALGWTTVAPPANSQVRSTTDIILGRVTGPDSLALENARVEVTSAESGITRNRLTNAKGQYSIVFPDGGGAYTLRVTYLGMAPFQTTIQRQADEDRLVANVYMSRAQAHELAPSSSADNNGRSRCRDPKPATPSACSRQARRRACPPR